MRRAHHQHRDSTMSNNTLCHQPKVEPDDSCFLTESLCHQPKVEPDDSCFLTQSLCHQPKVEPDDSCFLTQFQTLDPLPCYYDLHRQGNHTPCKASTELLYSTLESSPLTVETFNMLYNISPCDNISFLFDGSPTSQLNYLSQPYDRQRNHHSLDNNSTYGSPKSGSTVTEEDTSGRKRKFTELETAMLGHDSHQMYSYNSSSFQRNSARDQPAEMIAQKDLKSVLIACARAVSDNDLSLTRRLIDVLGQMVSVSGLPIQRSGAYMLEGLIARLASSGSSICKALRFKEPASSDLLSYTQILFEACPYIKFGYMSANGAIAEAMKDEEAVHIIDFDIGQGSQWSTLIQAFAARPGGPPRIRITGVDDLYTAYAHGSGGLEVVGKRLAMLAHSFSVPFEFNGAVLAGSKVKKETFRVRPGEALAVNFAFTLHHMPDEGVSTDNHRDRLLRMVKSLSPKVVTLVEQECNTNSAAFFPRFVETLEYYTAMFESMDVALPRDHKDRINVEQYCLARDVVNLIACEGAERVERHELLGKWRLRFLMAGFSPYPLSSLVNTTIKSLLMNYCDKYSLEEKDGALYLGWRNRNLVASCAWKC